MPVIVRTRDVVNAGYCTAGLRAWCARHEIDFRDFVRNGMPVEQFLATGCPMAAHIVSIMPEADSHG